MSQFQGLGSNGTENRIKPQTPDFLLGLSQWPKLQRISSQLREMRLVLMVYLAKPFKNP